MMEKVDYDEQIPCTRRDKIKLYVWGVISGVSVTTIVCFVAAAQSMA